MSRMPRVHIEEALCYVTSRGDHNQNIFKDKEDYTTYIELLKKYKQQYGFNLFSFVLLPNHLHLLIELKEGVTISEIMHDLNSSYIKYFNGRHNRRGHLLQERFKLTLIEKQPYLLCMTAYMHLNPCKLGLVPELKEYPYSSYSYYLNLKTEELKNLKNEEPNLDEEIKEILSYLAECQTYEDFVKGFSEEDRQMLSERLYKRKILGTKAFKEKVREQITKYKRQAAGSRSQMSKRFVLAGGLAVLILGLVVGHFYRINLGLRNEFKNILLTKELEVKQRIAKEKKQVKRGLKERYAADRVSYRGMVRRLEIEKKKAKELEERIEKLGKK